jgi:hypothetical protein
MITKVAHQHAKKLSDRKQGLLTLGDRKKTGKKKHNTKVCGHNRHRSTQGLVLDSAPRMVYLISRRLLVSHYRSSTASLRLPLYGMRALPPMLTLLSSPHSIGSPNRYSATGSPSRISSSCLWARTELNS